MKYEITAMTHKIVDPTTKVVHTLHRICALQNFKTSAGFEVIKGQLGGLVENEENLSQDGLCWIDLHAMAYGNARVTDDALLYGKDCFARDHALIGGQAIIRSSDLSGNVVADGKVRIFNDCSLSGNVRVTGEACLDFDVHAFGDAVISDYVHCTNGTTIEGRADLSGRVFVQGGHIRDRARLTGMPNLRNTLVGDDARVDGCAFTDNCWVIHDCHVGGIAVMGLGFKAEKGMYLDGTHCGYNYRRSRIDAALLKLAMAFKDHERVFRFLMGKIRGLSQNYLVVPYSPSQAAAIMRSNG